MKPFIHKPREVSHPEVSLDVLEGCRPTKKQIRYSMLAKRDAIPYSEVLAGALSVREHLRTWTVFRDAKCVCCYVSVRSEMPTPGIIIRAHESGKRVIVPKVVGDNLKFAQINSLTDDLKRGTFGVLEPLDSCTEVPIEEADICLIPGVVFDEHGNRFGYGKGYYDRFLKNLPPNIPTVGMAFDSQVLDSIPVDPTDVPVKYLVTPERGIFPVS